MHVAFIMDGNRRWAKQNALEAVQGHRKGAENLDRVLNACAEQGVKTVTLYALSTENFTNRNKSEVEYLLEMLRRYAVEYKEKMLERNIQVKILGKLSELPEKVQNSLNEVVEATKHCSDYLLQIAINYGGRDEIIRAVRSLIENGEEITEEALTSQLDTSSEPHLVVRTGGNVRTSNFLMWQSAYSEWYFTDTLWPDFDYAELEKALDYFREQQRNFGK